MQIKQTAFIQITGVLAKYVYLTVLYFFENLNWKPIVMPIQTKIFLPLNLLTK